MAKEALLKRSQLLQLQSQSHPRKRTGQYNVVTVIQVNTCYINFMSSLLQDDGGFNDASMDVPFQFEIEGTDAVMYLGPIFHCVGLGTLIHECHCNYATVFDKLKHCTTIYRQEAMNA